MVSLLLAVVAITIILNPVFIYLLAYIIASVITFINDIIKKINK